MLNVVMSNQGMLVHMIDTSGLSTLVHGGHQELAYSLMVVQLGNISLVR